MRVLYVDPICYKGHITYNRNNVKILSRLCDLSVLFLKDYFSLDGIALEKVFSYKTPRKCFLEHSTIKNKFIKRIFTKFGSIRIMNEVNRIAQDGNYDLVIFSCFDIIPFALTTKHKKNYAVINHSIDRVIENKIIRYYFLNIDKNIKMIVFEDFIKQYLEQRLNVKNDVYILHHPINNVYVTNGIKKEIKDEQSVNVFAPSGSNSDNIIKEFVEKSQNIMNASLCMRGNIDYETAHMKVYSKVYLCREDYESKFYDANYILIPYDKSFICRVSGVLFDALALKKRIVLFGGNSLEYYAKKYPHIITVVNSVEEFIEFINNKSKQDVTAEYDNNFYAECEQYLQDYSDDAISKEFQDIILGISQ